MVSVSRARIGVVFHSRVQDEIQLGTIGRLEGERRCTARPARARAHQQVRSLRRHLQHLVKLGAEDGAQQLGRLAPQRIEVVGHPLALVRMHHG
jgi:hypothetical protein